ncbi:hypothetical protein DCAR_0310481 [Daucus carota subsp. sativus]|uniref:Uncharacterized protein n=1 Tax=Daucus carota subsp. sativus TaxID=79200 RepID=A0A165ZWS3_DAUCS|nr:hypothetical protein DCAR_0310481 [Daucus carota subsp. sativus]
MYATKQTRSQLKLAPDPSYNFTIFSAIFFRKLSSCQWINLQAVYKADIDDVGISKTSTVVFSLQ